MITETTRRCRLCGAVLLDERAACPRCGGVPCPDLSTWPSEVIPWLVTIDSSLRFAPVLSFTRQQRAEYLLRSVVAGRQWGGAIIRLAAPATECLPVAIRASALWVAAGRPKGADAVLELSEIRGGW